MLPDSPRPGGYTTRLVRQVLSSDPRSGKYDRQTRHIGKDHWELTPQYNPMHKSSFGSVTSFLESRTPNDRFGVLVPDLTLSGTTPAPGKFVNIADSTKVYKIVDPGAAAPVNVLSNAIPSGGYYFSTIFGCNSGVPIGVFVDVSYTATAPTIRLASNATGAGTSQSNVVTLRQGRNLVILTPNTTATTYIEISQSAATTLKPGYAAVVGIRIDDAAAVMTPTPTAEHSDSYFFSLPAFVMQCSIDQPIQEVQYQSGGFVRLEVDLYERA
jgi:hypothetical protein